MLAKSAAPGLSPATKWRPLFAIPRGSKGTQTGAAAGPLHPYLLLDRGSLIPHLSSAAQSTNIYGDTRTFTRRTSYYSLTSLSQFGKTAGLQVSNPVPPTAWKVAELN